MKFISWNIDSLNAALTSDSRRAHMSREVLKRIATEEAQVIAFQETKLSAKGPTKKHTEILSDFFPEYDIVWRSSEEPARKGYAGTMYLIQQPLHPNVTFPKIGAPSTMDHEGRIITLEFNNFFLTQVYTPNAGRKLDRLKDRQIWDRLYADYLIELDQQKPVIATGDYNVAHQPIDLANPKSNEQSAGFTAEERAGFTHLLDCGFTDIFRHLHGDVEGIYTWWSQIARTSKINNSGWRIDYWLTSDRIKDEVIQMEVMDSGERQDHAPILITLDADAFQF